MPIIFNNNITRDTYSLRAERLRIIQGQFPTVQPLISAPAHIVTWTEDCYDIYSNLRDQSSMERSQAESATMDANLKAAIMAQVYQDARNLAMGLYHDDAVRFIDFGFDRPYPIAKNDKIARVKKVLETHSLHLAAGITNLIPATIITRLTNAKNDYETAISKQEKQYNESRYANFQLSERFDSDSAILMLLRSWWFSVMGKNDGRIDFIGMVNPKPIEGRGHRVDAPKDLNFDNLTKKVSWSEVLNATGYSLELSTNGIDYKKIYSGADNSFVYKNAIISKVYFRCRARNANGNGQYSPVLEVE